MSRVQQQPFQLMLSEIFIYREKKACQQNRRIFRRIPTRRKLYLDHISVLAPQSHNCLIVAILIQNGLK